MSFATYCSCVLFVLVFVTDFIDLMFTYFYCDCYLLLLVITLGCRLLGCFVFVAYIGLDSGLFV